MAYSMFEKPKLCITDSTKFYPAEDIAQPYNIPYRQKYPSGFELESTDLFKMMATKFSKGDHQRSICGKSSMNVKCPIYVHDFGKLIAAQQEGDFMKKAKKVGKNKKQPTSVLNKLEETYWAMWKPEKSTREVPVKVVRPKTALAHSPPRSARDTIDVLKNSPQSRKIKILPERKQKKIASRSKEIQTDETLLKPVVSKLKIDQEKEIKKSDSTESGAEKGKMFLRHTDSYILNAKKQSNKEKGERVEQPKCIKLYKKTSSTPSATTASFIKGGSYPLRSCLRKDGSFGKSNIKLGRPGSPMMLTSTTSNYKTKGQKK